MQVTYEISQNLFTKHFEVYRVEGASDKLIGVYTNPRDAENAKKVLERGQR